MKRLLLMLSILSLFSFGLENDSDLIVQRWYKIDGDKKILIRELFYNNFSQEELVKAVFYFPEENFTQTIEYENRLVTHFGAEMNSMELNNEYYHYDEYGNLISIVDSSRNSVSVTNINIKEYSQDNKALTSVDDLNDQKIVYKHEYPRNGHIKKTFLNDTLIDYESEYFYDNGKLKAKVKHVPETIYDSTYHHYEYGVKKREETYSKEGLRYSMNFKYKNDTLKEIDKHYPDGSIDKIIVEYD